MIYLDSYKYFKPQSEVISKREVTLQIQKQAQRRINSFSYPNGSYSMARWDKTKGFYPDPHNVAHQSTSKHVHDPTQPAQGHLFGSKKQQTHTHEMLQTTKAHCTILALLCGKSIRTFVCPHCQGQSIKNQPPCTTNLHRIAHRKTLTAFEPPQQTEGLNFQLPQLNWKLNWELKKGTDQYENSQGFAKWNK